MALNRLLCVDERERRPSWEDAVTQVMGDDAWKSLVYRKTETLFGTGDDEKASNTPEILMDLYRKKLQTAFNCVSSPALIRNTRGSPLYYLFWAGPHPAGLKGASYVLGGMKQLSKRARSKPMR